MSLKYEPAEHQVDLTRRQLGARGKEVEGKEKELQTALQQASPPLLLLLLRLYSRYRS